MANYKPGFKEILDKIERFMDEPNAISRCEEFAETNLLLEEIKKICEGVLDND